MKPAILKLLLLVPVAAISACKAPELINYVDPLIGTGAHGHTYPGASAPFGLVQLSPETRETGWDACSGYHYDDTTILGFSHTHLSGTGCADLKDILFYPSYSIRFDGDSLCGYTPSSFSHKKEKASCGHYMVELDCGIDVELTAEKRVGMHKYVFNLEKERKILISLPFVAEEDTLRACKIARFSDNEIKGMRKTDGWVKHQAVYFHAKFSEKFKSAEFLGDQYAILTFDKNIKEIIVGVALSSVSCENARMNLESEAPYLSFKKVKKKTQDSWNNILNKIQIKGCSEKEKRIFYTSVYHSFLAPNIINDSNGEYLNHSQSISCIEKGNKFYSTLSLWDTFRTWYPLMTVIDQDIVNQTIRSMLYMYSHTEELPIWPLWSGETRTMIGYHAVAVIADAYLKGIRDYDAEMALDAMIRSSDKNLKGSKYYTRYGYVPYDKITESVALTLEYSYDDWAIARMAEAMGKNEIARKYYERSEKYKNLFDTSSCFFRPRHSDGNWLTPFEKNATSEEYTEATAWQYRFFVPHDNEGLIKLFGTEKQFEEALDSLFFYEDDNMKISIEDVTGFMGQYAHGNEPGHHFPFLYNYIGRPHKSHAVTRKLLKEMYDDTPEGLPGNEDCGQMSAWYIMASIGLYPACPGSNEFILTPPIFAETKIKLNNRKILRIKANEPQKKNYIKCVRLNGKTISRHHITYDEIMSGGDLEFILTDNIEISDKSIFTKPYSKTK